MLWNSMEKQGAAKKSSPTKTELAGFFYYEILYDYSG